MSEHLRPVPPAGPDDLPEPDPVADEGLLGLRREDLDRDERRRLVAALSTAEGGAAREQAMGLAWQVSQLEAPESGLHAGHVLESLAARRRRRRLTWAAALGAVGLIAGAAGLAGLATAVWLALA